MQRRRERRENVLVIFGQSRNSSPNKSNNSNDNKTIFHRPNTIRIACSWSRLENRVPMNLRQLKRLLKELASVCIQSISLIFCLSMSIAIVWIRPMPSFIFRLCSIITNVSDWFSWFNYCVYSSSVGRLTHFSFPNDARRTRAFSSVDSRLLSMPLLLFIINEREIHRSELKSIMYNAFFSVAARHHDDTAVLLEKNQTQKARLPNESKSSERASERREKNRLSRRHRMCARMIELALDLLVRFGRVLRQQTKRIFSTSDRALPLTCRRELTRDNRTRRSGRDDGIDQQNESQWIVDSARTSPSI